MSVRNLLINPLWKGEDLGWSLPDSPHAISVSLPRWSDVVGYEEKHPAVLAEMKGGYPRFFISPFVQEIVRRFGDGKPGLPFPSETVANQCALFVHRFSGEKTEIHPIEGSTLTLVQTTDEGMPFVKAFWQHTGMIVSSRHADAVLTGSENITPSSDVHSSLRKQLAGFYGCEESDVFLAPTGMAAQFIALRAVMERSPGLPTAQLGFPYVDTLKLQQKIGVGATLLHNLNSIANDLQELIVRQPLAACFCEIPGNPTLGSADVREITPILRQHGIPLVVDDVVATPFNIDLSQHADLITTSLTKYISGTGDVMGGAVICNPKSPYHAALKQIIARQHEDLLWWEDATVINTQAYGFPERMKLHNANGLYLAEKLCAHPGVERVWYPKWEFSEVYESVRRPDGGWGSLITFLPKNAEITTPRIYDALALCKGPSLGTVFTLVCPFTMLAHYTELDWAESCGVPRYLLRISAGIEDVEVLWDQLQKALEA